MPDPSTAPRVRILGSGNAFQQDGRGSPALLVEAGRAGRFLVDAGPTVLGALHRQGIPAAGLDRLFVTHLHGDHTAGWPFLLLEQVLRERRVAPFEVHGPAGTETALEGLVRLCYPGLERHRRHRVRYHERRIGEGRTRAGGLELEVVAVDHHPSSLGYRFYVDGRCLAVSGDTRWCDALVSLAAGADLLVLECSDLLPTEGHLSLRELRTLRGRLAPRGPIVLVHLNDAVALQLARDPLADVVASYDGMELELGAGTP